MPSPPLRPAPRRRVPRWPLLGLALAAAIVGLTAGWTPRGNVSPAAVRPAHASSRAHPASPPPAAQPLVSMQHPLPHVTLRVKAPAAILVDGTTGAVLWARRPFLRRPIASTTKIMTGVLALQRLRPHDVVSVPVYATRVEPTKEGLRANERVPVWKLLYGLLLSSGNDTAVTLAVAAGGTRAAFIRLMNEKAREIGLRHTHFRSPSGLLDEDNYSTVWDLAALARYAMKDPIFRAIVRTKRKLVRWAPPVNAKLYENHNRLLWTYRGADGIKTGWTRRAGACLVASARRHGVRLVTVVLDSPDHYGDTKRLLDYGFRVRG